MLFPLWIFIPDFYPRFWISDDVILFPALVSLTVKFIPEDVLKKIGEMLRESGRLERLEMVLYDSSCGSVGDYNWGIGCCKMKCSDTPFSL